MKFPTNIGRPIASDCSGSGTITSTAPAGFAVINLTGTPSGDKFSYELPGAGTYQITNSTSTTAQVGGFDLVAGATLTFGFDGTTTTIVPGVESTPKTSQAVAWNGTAWEPQYGNGPIYNVCDAPWDFDNTGATDNSAKLLTLAAAITSSTAGMGTVKFPSGVYQFTQSVPATAFPMGTVFVGSDYMYGTTLRYSGTGTFWNANSNQAFENLLFASNYAGPHNDNPGQQNVILNASNTAPIALTFAVPHTYTTGDLLGIYGVQGNINANNDQATLNPCTVTGDHSVTLDGSDGTIAGANAAFTILTGAITGVSNAAGGIMTPIVVTVSAPLSELHTGQLVYIDGVSGACGTAVNGLQRVWILPGPITSATTSFGICAPNLSAPQASSGTYSAGGTVHAGGASVQYSHQALIGLNFQAPPGISSGPQRVQRCWFANFKYGISLDGVEGATIQNCLFDGNMNTAGYAGDTGTNDRTHSSFGLRFGSFYNNVQQNTNTNYLEKAQFFGHYAAAYFTSCCTNTMRDCNHEQPVVAIINNGVIGLLIENAQNDGSWDTLGCIQFANDNPKLIPYTENFTIHIERLSVTSAGGPAIGSTGGANVHGLVVSGYFDSTNLPFILNGMGITGMDASRFACNRTDAISDGAGGIIPSGPSPVPYYEDTNALFHTGTPINFVGFGKGALDVGYFPYAGISPAEWPAIRVAQPMTGGMFHARHWTTGTQYGGSGSNMQMFDSILDTSAVATNGRKGHALGYVVTYPAAANLIGATIDLPTINYGQYELEVTVEAACYGVVQKSARWKWKQQVHLNVNLSPNYILETADEVELYDGIGLTDPTIAIVAGTPQTAQVTVYADTPDYIFYTTCVRLIGGGN